MSLMYSEVLFETLDLRNLQVKTLRLLNKG